MADEAQRVRLGEIRDRNVVKYFFEVVDSNSGAVSPFFDDKASALEWLNSQSEYAV